MSNSLKFHVAFVLCFLGLFMMSSAYNPVVVLHGIDASNDTLSHMKSLIEANVDGIYVRNLEIGNGKADTFLFTMNEQVETMCKELAADEHLGDEINIVAVSQGALVSRGYIERCNSPKVKNFVSWVGPQAGVFGIPKVEPFCRKYFGNSTICDLLDNTFDEAVYTKFVQDHLGFAGYWKDMLKYDKYLEHCEYLPDIDNMNKINEQYKNNILGLEHLVLVHSTIDVCNNLLFSSKSDLTVFQETLVPRETSSWAFYAEDDLSRMVPLEESDIYIRDTIGLKQLDESGRLVTFNMKCPHWDYYSDVFDKYFEEFALPFLK